ncbi:maleylpyruvate isomerase family mycothiol-dependent enzyme [Tsukamurella sp. PLM1]|uniref:maleylpyruvate isomerase family mycothiol-dependent enzyme n=1 Tax=Tsukamurella sp. PLM1 TaxID=2929795 RepID=UPI0035301CBD
MKPARIERAALVDAARAAGPDAPTLCGEWNVRELLAHLVVREGRLDAAPGILLRPLAGYTEHVQAKYAARPFDELLDAVADGHRDCRRSGSSTNRPTSASTSSTPRTFGAHARVGRLASWIPACSAVWRRSWPGSRG